MPLLPPLLALVLLVALLPLLVPLPLAPVRSDELDFCDGDLEEEASLLVLAGDADDDLPPCLLPVDPDCGPPPEGDESEDLLPAAREYKE